MDDFLQQIYLIEVKQQCEYCFEAVQKMNAILKDREKGDFFREAHYLVHHAAAISRIFWPPKGRDKEATKRAKRRGRFLRDLLGLTSGHPIENRALRDHFEHFDERLDDWAEKSRYRSIVDRFIGPRGAIRVNGIHDTDFIRHYDPAKKTLSFRGERFDVQALASGLDDIYNHTVKRLAEIEANKRLKPTHSPDPA
jgi:hypothetical protein